MNKDEKAPHGQQYSVGTGNIITGGTIGNSPMTNVSGGQNRVDITNKVDPGQQQPWPRQLQAELTRIRVLLEENCSASSDDRDDAIDAVRALEAEVASATDSGQADPKGFRWRVKALIGVLAPLAEIIGGVAALQAIAQHL